MQIGGFISSTNLSDNTVNINPEIVQQLSDDYNIESASQAYLFTEIFATENLTDPFNIAILLIGGILVGFGAR